MPFCIDGEHGLLASLEARLALRDHAVIVVAEGCAASIVDPNTAQRDASGNLRYAAGGSDVGPGCGTASPRTSRPGAWRRR
jgi:hypothetical protein